MAKKVVMHVCECGWLVRGGEEAEEGWLAGLAYRKVLHGRGRKAVVPGPARAQAGGAVRPKHQARWAGWVRGQRLRALDDDADQMMKRQWGLASARGTPRFGHGRVRACL